MKSTSKTDKNITVLPKTVHPKTSPLVDKSHLLPTPQELGRILENKLHIELSKYFDECLSGDNDIIKKFGNDVWGIDHYARKDNFIVLIQDKWQKDKPNIKTINHFILSTQRIMDYNKDNICMYLCLFISKTKLTKASLDSFTSANNKTYYDIYYDINDDTSIVNLINKTITFLKNYPIFILPHLKSKCNDINIRYKDTWNLLDYIRELNNHNDKTNITHTTINNNIFIYNVINDTFSNNKVLNDKSINDTFSNNKVLNNKVLNNKVLNNKSINDTFSNNKVLNNKSINDTFSNNKVLNDKSINGNQEKNKKITKEDLKNICLKYNIEYKVAWKKNQYIESIIEYFNKYNVKELQELCIKNKINNKSNWKKAEYIIALFINNDNKMLNNNKLINHNKMTDNTNYYNELVNKFYERNYDENNKGLVDKFYQKTKCEFEYFQTFLNENNNYNKHLEIIEKCKSIIFLCIKDEEIVDLKEKCNKNTIIWNKDDYLEAIIDFVDKHYDFEELYNIFKELDISPNNTYKSMINDYLCVSINKRNKSNNLNKFKKIDFMKILIDKFNKLTNDNTEYIDLFIKYYMLDYNNSFLNGKCRYMIKLFKNNGEIIYNNDFIDALYEYYGNNYTKIRLQEEFKKQKFKYDNNWTKKDYINYLIKKIDINDNNIFDDIFRNYISNLYTIDELKIKCDKENLSYKSSWRKDDYINSLIKSFKLSEIIH
jgi:hypothetical protein